MALPSATTSGPLATLANSGSRDLLLRTHTARQVAFLWSCYVSDEDAVFDTIYSSVTLTELPLPSVGGYVRNLDCFEYHHPQPSESGQADEPPLPPPQKCTNGLLTHFWVDASIPLAVHLLQVHPGDKILDLWHSTSTMAAKSIVLAQAMWLVPPSSDDGVDDPTPGILHFNDSTFSRPLPYMPSPFGCALAGTLGEYVPPEATESGNLRRIQEVPRPTDDHLDFAKRLPFPPGGYDKVIFDVDTVGEQIFPPELNPHQSQVPGPQETILEMTVRYRAAYIQLLITALDAVRIGGRVVYCAPSADHDEHDRIVYRAVHHTRLMEGPWLAEVETLPEPMRRKLREDWARQTRKGWLVMPDHEAATQSGPFYIAMIKKMALPRRGGRQIQWRPQDIWEKIELEEVTQAFSTV